MLNRLKNVAARLLLVALAGATLNAAATDIADVPMAVKNNVAANFMFMVDNSGSMTNIVPESPYSASTTYLADATCSGRQPYTGYGSAALAAAGSNTFDISVTSAGVPRIVYGGSTFTFGTSGSAKCFRPGLYYNARLVGDYGTNPKTPSSYLDAVFSGNFLNWYYGAAPGYSTPDTFDYSNTGGARKSGTRTRLEIAKLATNATLDALPLKTATTTAKVRVGLSTYNGADGGALRIAMGDLDATKLSATKTSVNGLTASGSTPLSETLADIGRYFSTPLANTDSLTLRPDSAPTTATVGNVFRQGSTLGSNLSGFTNPAGCSKSTGAAPSSSTPNCPVQYWCQRSYTVLLTDGRPQNDQALSTNTVLCDYAGIIGSCPTSGDNAYGKKTNTTHAGHLGGAHSYESGGSDYLDDVAKALFDIDLRPDLLPPAGRSKKNNIRTYTISFADDQAKDDPLLQETAALGGGLFQTADDTASLVNVLTKAVNDAFAKDGASAAVAVVNTQITVENTAYASSYNSGTWFGDLEAFRMDTSTGIPISPSIWSAQTLLNSRTASDRFIATYNGSVGVAFTAYDTGLDANLVSYIRGDRSLEGTTYRRRSHLLGDIVNAEPVVVKYGTAPIVFQAANDGMLHVFDGSLSGATAGRELWAYTPQLVQGKLATIADLNYTHTFLIDATPTIADLTLSTVDTKLLVGGLGAGGRGYYALDITTGTAVDEAAAAAKVKWEALGSEPEQGLSYGTPLVVNTANGWVVLVSSGYNNGTNTGGTGRGKVFVLDPADGSVLQTIDTGVGTAAAPAGLGPLGKATNTLAADVIRFVYAGDLLGNVWRFDLSTWSATKIAELRDGGGDSQPISTAPVVKSNGSIFSVHVGTGLYLGESDVPGNTPENAWARQQQTMYTILDNTAITPSSVPNIRGTNGSTCPDGGGDGDFLCQNPGPQVSGQYSFTAYPMGVSHKGWYVDLPLTNGRIVTTPQLTSGGTLAFTVNVPTNVTCDPGGSSWFFAVDAANGGAILKTYGGTDYYATGAFLANALASRPVVIDTSSGKRAVIRLSDRSFASPPVPEPPLPPTSTPPTWRRIYWRELM